MQAIKNMTGFVFHRTTTALTSCLMCLNKSQTCTHIEALKLFERFRRLQFLIKENSRMSNLMQNNVSASIPT